MTNLEITRAVAADGFYYAPDPSSQQVCTIGGNVAENSGGAHCLKYGFTVNHVLAADVVLPDGELVTLSRDDDGPDLLGVFVGSEGTLGIAARVTVNVLRVAESVRTLLAAFESTDAAGEAVSRVIAGGILPAAIEMMDALTLEAVEAAVSPGYPAGAGAVLIVELDGPAVAGASRTRPRSRRSAASAARSRSARPRRAEERARIWRGRKSSFAAMGRISPSYYVQDGVVPRTRLPEVLRRIDALGDEYGLRIASVFHAGDGNLHPLVLYDDGVEGEPELRRAARDGDPRRLHRRGRLAHRRARRRRRQGVLDAEALRRATTSRRWRGCATPSIRTGSRTRARCCRRRACAARCRGRTARTRWSGPGLPSVSEPRDRSAEAAEAMTAGGTRLDRPRRAATSCSRRARLDRVLEHEPGDLTAIVEAGIRLSALQAALAPHGQMLALDPPGDPTIGACLAGDLSGPRRHRYGAMRDLVIGVTVVLADGTIASSGGKVVKNVAGYDLGKLFSGSRGRLGLIARVALRLHTRPAAKATVVAETDDPRAALERAAAVAARAERRRLPAARPARAALRGRRGRRRRAGRGVPGPARRRGRSGTR